MFFVISLFPLVLGKLWPSPVHHWTRHSHLPKPLTCCFSSGKQFKTHVWINIIERTNVRQIQDVVQIKLHWRLTNAIQVIFLCILNAFCVAHPSLFWWHPILGILIYKIRFPSQADNGKTAGCLFLPFSFRHVALSTVLSNVDLPHNNAWSCIKPTSNASQKINVLNLKHQALQNLEHSPIQFIIAAIGICVIAFCQN